MKANQEDSKNQSDVNEQKNPLKYYPSRIFHEYILAKNIQTGETEQSLKDVGGNTVDLSKKEFCDSLLNYSSVAQSANGKLLFVAFKGCEAIFQVKLGQEEPEILGNFPDITIVYMLVRGERVVGRFGDW